MSPLTRGPQLAKAWRSRLCLWVRTFSSRYYLQYASLAGTGERTRGRETRRRGTRTRGLGRVPDLSESIILPFLFLLYILYADTKALRSKARLFSAAVYKKSVSTSTSRPSITSGALFSFIVTLTHLLLYEWAMSVESLMRRVVFGTKFRCQTSTNLSLAPSKTGNQSRFLYPRNILQGFGRAKFLSARTPPGSLRSETSASFPPILFPHFWTLQFPLWCFQRRSFRLTLPGA